MQASITAEKNIKNSDYRKFCLSPRLKKLQEDSPKRSAIYPSWLRNHNMLYASHELYSGLSGYLRRACSLSYALRNEPVHLFAEERLHGVFYPYSTIKPETFYNKHNEDDMDVRGYYGSNIPGLDDLTGINLPENEKTTIISTGGFPGHVAWNWDKLLAIGVEGMIAEHEEKLSSLETSREDEDFHRAVIICLQAMLDWNRRHIKALKELLQKETAPERRKFIEESIEIMEHVPAKPARNFHEALQSYHFQWTCVMYESPYGGNSPGRLDYLLWPYLKDELETGKITYQEAGELVAELFIKCDERSHSADGHVSAVVLGGVAPDGSNAASPLSIIMLEVISSLNITHPSIYSRIHPSNPEEYVQKSIEYLLKGNNRGQIFNDRALINAMMRNKRMPFEDAARYIAGGCMEVNPQGLNSDLIWSFLYSAPKTLEMCLTGGFDLVTGHQRLPLDKSLENMKTFEEFYDYYISEVRRTLTAKFQELDIVSEKMGKQRPQFFISSMVDDCLERGRDIHNGGARYHDYGGSVLGIANAADSLIAIKKAVFDEKFCTPNELQNALVKNFENNKLLQNRLLSLPKYGQGDCEVDNMMKRLVNDVCAVFDSYTTRFEGVVKMVNLTFTFGVSLGKNLGASPDGRLSGKPLAHGLTPQSSAQTAGLTTAINSYSLIDNEKVSGGSSTMWDMDPDWINHDLLNSIVKTFMEKGGQIFQGNMTKVEELEAALKEPEKHNHLIVRVGGFSARFTSLSKELQQEIISRRRHKK